MAQAAHRGAEVSIAADAYSLMELVKKGRYIVDASKIEGQSTRYRRNALAEVDRAPSSVANFVNMPSGRIARLHTGRSHLKIGAVNDYFTVIGLNHDLQQVMADLAFGATHQGVADWVHQKTQQVAIQRDTRKVLGTSDLEYRIDPYTKLMVDVGVPFQSAIFQEAGRIITEAETDVWHASQAVPRGRIMEHLTQAADADQRKVNVEAIFNHSNGKGILPKMVEKALIGCQDLKSESARSIRDNNPTTKSSPYIHAKGVGSEREAMGGNHNLDDAGIVAGTVDAMILQQTQSFSNRARACLVSQL